MNYLKRLTHGQIKCLFCFVKLRSLLCDIKQWNVISTCRWIDITQNVWRKPLCHWLWCNFYYIAKFMSITKLCNERIWKMDRTQCVIDWKDKKLTKKKRAHSKSAVKFNSPYRKLSFFITFLFFRLLQFQFHRVSYVYTYVTAMDISISLFASSIFSNIFFIIVIK